MTYIQRWVYCWPCRPCHRAVQARRHRRACAHQTERERRSDGACLLPAVCNFAAGSRATRYYCTIQAGYEQPTQQTGWGGGKHLRRGSGRDERNNKSQGQYCQLPLPPRSTARLSSTGLVLHPSSCLTLLQLVYGLSGAPRWPAGAGAPRPLGVQNSQGGFVSSAAHHCNKEFVRQQGSLQ